MVVPGCRSRWWRRREKVGGERPCLPPRSGASNGSVPDDTPVVTRMAREHSQAHGLAREHPGARGKADWWHAVFQFPYAPGGTSELPPSDRRHASTPGYGEQACLFQHKGTINAKGKTGPRWVGRPSRRSRLPFFACFYRLFAGHGRSFRSGKFLLQAHLGAAFLQFLLDGVGLVLGDVLLDRLGAPSTSSLASLRPRLVISRTTLMTLIFLAGSASPSRTTVNSVCSGGFSAGPAATGGTGHDDAAGGRFDLVLLLEVVFELDGLGDGQGRDLVAQLRDVGGEAGPISFSHCVWSFPDAVAA